MSSMSKGLSLNIFGGSGFFNTTPLVIQSENRTSIVHKTNWDSTLSGPFVTNSTDSKNFEFKLSDYSKNKYDSYYNYGSNDGNYVEYNYDISWYTNDIDMDDDIAVATTKNWNSIEKNTYNIGSSGVTVDSIINLGVQITTGGYCLGCNETEWSIGWDTKHNDSANGILTVTVTKYADYCGDGACSSTVTRTYTFTVIDNLDSTGSYALKVTSLTEPTYTFSGTGYPSVDINQLGIQIVGDGRQDCDGYFIGGRPNDNGGSLACAFTYLDIVAPYTFFNIKSIADILQKEFYLSHKVADDNIYDFYNPNKNILLSNTPMGRFADSNFNTYEFPDYSDIFIEVDYVKGAVGNDPVVSGNNIVVPTEDPNVYGSQYLSTKKYSFGGFISSAGYITKMQKHYGQNKYNSINYLLTDYDEYKWYMVYRESNGDYEFVTLSSYINPAILSPLQIETLQGEVKYLGIGRAELINGYNLKYFASYNDDGTRLPISHGFDYRFFPPTSNDGGVALLPLNNIITSGIRLIKYISHPNCGKADIYIKKTGKVTSINNNIITSSGHGLSDGDVVKFSSALNVSNAAYLTNLNGVKYISGVTTNTFNIYSSEKFIAPDYVINLKTVSGINWTAAGPKNWDYKSTLYSPMGKNGYGFTPQVRLVDESSVTGITIFDRAVESSTFIDPNSSVIKPQSALNNWVSWNNYYPFNRANSETTMSDPLYNGNKFGSDVQVQKIKDNKYLLMVTEPGAEVSFPMFEDYFLDPANKIIPDNKFQPPVYLPQGRVHFYTITKDPFNVEYLTSISHPGNPWELTSYFYQIARDGQYAAFNPPIVDITTIYNRNNNNYWLGGRFYAWNKPYAFEPSYGIGVPNYPKYPNEFGFLDSFGKSAAFDIDGSSIYCVASTNVKSAGFGDTARMLYVDALSEAFALNFTSNFNALSSTSALSGIVHQSNYSTNNIDSQLIEINKFALNVDFDESKLFIGWPSYGRGEENIFIYNRVGSGYQPFQTLTQAGDQNDFGNYFVADNNMLVTNAYNRINGAFIPENPPFVYNSLYVYRQDPLNQQYYLLQNISPTMDLSNPIYSGMNSKYYTTGVTNYTRNTNLSYDNTTGNSATQQLDLQGRYDIYNNSLVMRDLNEFIYFEFDGKNKKFAAKNHKMITDVNLLSENAVLRMRPSNASYIESYPTSEFIESLDVLEGSTYFSNIRILNESYPRPTYLPLFLKSIEGAPNTGIILQTKGHLPFNSGSILYTQGPIPTGSGMNMFMKMPDIKSSGMDLFMKQYIPLDSGTTLYIKDQQANQGMTLNINTQLNINIPLFVKVHSYKYSDENGDPVEVDELGNYSQGMYLNIVNRHTGVPNASGYLNLSLRTYESDDISNILNLVINQDYPTSTSGINLFMPDPTGTNRFSIKNDLYLQGPEFIRGTDIDNSLNLVIHRTPEVAMPLTVYNTYTASGLNTYVKGTNLASSGTTLYASGAGLPTGSMTVYVDGTVL